MINGSLIRISDSNYDRLFDENIRDHMHNSQAIYLGECTAFLVEQVSPFESKVSLVRNFCNIIMKSSDKDRLLKVSSANQYFSCIFPSICERPFFMLSSLVAII